MSEVKCKLSLHTCALKKKSYVLWKCQENPKMLLSSPNILQGTEKSYIPAISLACYSDLNLLRRFCTIKETIYHWKIVSL